LKIMPPGIMFGFAPTESFINRGNSMRAFVSYALVAAAACTLTMGCGDKGGKDAGEKSGAKPLMDATSADADVIKEQKNTELAREFTEKVLNQGDMAFLEQHTAPTFVEHDPMPGQEPGVAGMRKSMEELRAAFPDMKVTVQDVIPHGDFVVIRSTMVGTQSGPMMGEKPTGRKVSDVEGIDIVHVVDGKMTEHWGLMDNVKMMTQLGMMPAPDGEKK
jgi:predicted ester cyclase